MKTLFPEMDAEIREDRRAARRESVQRARDYLRDKDTSWLVHQLLDHGPQRECELLDRYLNEHGASMEGVEILRMLHSLWRVGKLWRENCGFFAPAGVDSFRYGIRKVHPVPKPS